jgi:hypothetical protein
MAFNATFNNISAISCRSVLLVEKTGVIIYSWHGITRMRPVMWFLQISRPPGYHDQSRGASERFYLCTTSTESPGDYFNCSHVVFWVINAHARCTRTTIMWYKFVKNLSLAPLDWSWYPGGREIWRNHITGRMRVIPCHEYIIYDKYVLKIL